MTPIRSLLIAGGILAIAGSAQAAESYRFSGGPAGGAWHPATSAGTQILNKELGDKYTFNYTPSNGSVENVRRISLGDADTAWGHVGQIYQSWTGTGAFEAEGPSKDFRLIANVRKQSQIIAVLADSPIKSYSDMKGKVVNLLNKGSGSSVNCVNMFKALGLFDEIEERYLGFSASARALGDRQIDVFCSAGVPNTIPALTELSINKPVRYVSLSDDEQKKILEENPFYAAYTIPVQADVKGMDAPAKTIAYDVWWMANKNMPDDAVYDMLKTVNSEKNLEQLAATAAYWKTLSGDFSSLESLGVKVHPAAAKYWREQGVDVSDKVVEGF